MPNKIGEPETVASLGKSLAILSLAASQPAAAAAVAGPALSSHAAQSAGAFVGSLGVVSHIDSGSAPWTNATILLNELSYLGISTLRDGTPFDYALPTFVALAQAGIHFDLLEANVYSFDQTGQINAALDVGRAHQLEAAVPGSVISFEGSNEYTTNNYTLNGALSAGNLSWGLADAAALSAAVHADPLFAGVAIIAPSAIQLDSLPDFSGLANGSNVHIYGGVGQQLQDLIINSVGFARASLPGAPVYITETGISSSGYGTSTWGVANEQAQAVIDLNAVLDGFSAGASMTFLYELMDEPSAANAQEQHFGLFHADGTPKLAATAIGNLTHLLADDGTGTVAPGNLDYALSGLPAGASSMLLEKSDGTFELVLWNGRATLWDGTGQVTPPASTVTLTLGQTASSIQLFDPLLGTGALVSLANAGSIGLQLSADPLVIQLSFAPAAAAPPPPSATNVILAGNAATVTGIAEAGSRVSVFEGTRLLGAATADPSGHWTLGFTASNSPQHALTVSQVTASGQTVAAAGLTLFGKAREALVGGVGDDVLIGAAGDRLTGGLGSDHFVINSGSGKESITDFRAGTSGVVGDQLYVDHRLAASFADVMAHATQSGTSVVIAFDKATVVTLEHVDIASLHAGDFLLF
ncbi:MAG: Ig-like domain-containing protein [Sphingomicrobium sp.]